MPSRGGDIGLAIFVLLALLAMSAVASEPLRFVMPVVFGRGNRIDLDDAFWETRHGCSRISKHDAAGSMAIDHAIQYLGAAVVASQCLRDTPRIVLEYRGKRHTLVGVELRAVDEPLSELRNLLVADRFLFPTFETVVALRVQQSQAGKVAVLAELLWCRC